MYQCFRLERGTDLKKFLEDYAIENHISGVVLSCVGCLSKLNIRLADSVTILEREEAFEIVSITGTLSEDGVHLHISVSDSKGNVFGGHLKNGCIVNTTAEVCLLEFEDIKLNREFDDNTGYEELVIRKLI